MRAALLKKNKVSVMLCTAGDEMKDKQNYFHQHLVFVQNLEFNTFMSIYIFSLTFVTLPQLFVLFRVS